MKVLISGASGQLGQALLKCVPKTYETLGFNSRELNICDPSACQAIVSEHAPDIIINAAAYTAVDRAETDEHTAFGVNRDGPKNLKDAARSIDAQLVHVSTDFIFNGTSSIPYRTNDVPSPRSIYGHSKLAGEQAVGPEALIIRTAWVYASYGGNFVRTMLNLMRTRDRLSVVSDQIGTPTWASSLAEAVWILVQKKEQGIHHFTDSGTASWYDFAIAIQEEALNLGLLNRAIPIAPITTQDFPTPAERPHFSVLDKTTTYAALGYHAPHWRVQLRKMLKEMLNNG